MPDFAVEDHGSLVLFRPLTDEVKQWIDEYVMGEPQWFGGALVVEYRYSLVLYEALVEAGFNSQ